ncbi:hypothetical protein MSIMFB_04210 [Mycobacterium simulans]|uniref:Uncharacterized protein n=1 Tax=Mycobacterium simulans TaxID=627089 RepID=A0A7Z7NC43_9MYCO|nr:hypothetical protein MSIMFB_04210 [Mycobacterium simulans]SON61075.1 hypothetical protein MSIMFI_02580 [Mycobacterium simulans]
MSDSLVLCWVTIHSLAAWQAWKYCSSVESAGTSTLVVTPAGETPMAPGGSKLATLDDRADEEAALPLTSLCEQPVTVDKHAAAMTIPHCRGT